MKTFIKLISLLAMTFSMSSFAQMVPNEYEGLSNDQVSDMVAYEYETILESLDDQLFTEENQKNHPRPRPRPYPRPLFFVCLAQNWSGQRFFARSPILRAAQIGAINYCRSRSYFPFSCHLVQCRRFIR